MSNIVDFNGLTTLNMQADRVLESATGNLEDAIVIGYNKDGEFYFASSVADGGDILWLLESAKKRLLDNAAELEKGL